MLHWIIKIFIYFLFTSLLGYIPVNRSFVSSESGIEIFIISNGVHTDMVLPISSELIEWNTVIPYEDFRPFWKLAEYIAFGWGERGFYINTPEWKDLKIKTALKALFIPSESVMHVTLAPIPIESDYCRKVIISKEKYTLLIEYILSSFKMSDDQLAIRIPHPGYSKYDLFYESEKKFHLFKTCNSWTNAGLKQAGIRTSLWTPFDKPILYHLARIKK